MARLLFVSRDIGGTKMLVPIAKAAKATGHKVMVVCEGKGAPLWFNAGIDFYFVSEETASAGPINLVALFWAVNPEMVLVETGRPVGLTKSIGIFANKMGVPVVIVEDYWAAVQRLPEVKPSLVLTIDEHAANIASACAKAPVAVIGNHAVLEHGSYKPDEKVLRLADKLREEYDELFFYAGGHSDTGEEEIQLLVDSLKMTPGNWALVVKYHPKYQDNIHPVYKEKYSAVWDRMLQPLQNFCRFDEGLSDDWAVTADVCFSAFSSSLTTAISAGKIIVTLKTGKVVKALTEGNLKENPWVALGVASAIDKPQNLRPLLVPPKPSQLTKFRPLDAALALKKIEELLQKVSNPA